MSWSVWFDEREQIVVARLWGKATRQEHWDVQTRIIELCREKSCTNVLVDACELITQGLTTTDCLELGESAARKARFLRIAHVLPRDPRSREDMRFTSTVEANRGLETREFDSTDEAREWLAGRAKQHGK